MQTFSTGRVNARHFSNQKFPPGKLQHKVNKFNKAIVNTWVSSSSTFSATPLAILPRHFSRRFVFFLLCLPFSHLAFDTRTKKNSISDTFVVLFYSRINSFLTTRCVCMINLSNIFVKITASKVNKSDLLKCSPQNIWRLLKFKSLHGNEAKARKKYDSVEILWTLDVIYIFPFFFSPFFRNSSEII